MVRVWKELEELGRILQRDKKAEHRVTEPGLGRWRWVSGGKRGGSVCPGLKGQGEFDLVALA